MKSILILALTFAIITGCQPNEKYAAERIAGELSTQHSLISYTSCGQGDLVVLLVHGWNIDQSYWSAQQSEFCNQYRVITMDLPGFGSSQNKPGQFSISSYARDVNDLIAHLDLERVVLVGHSMGGRVILEAAQNNDKVVALIGVDNYKEIRQELTPELKIEIDGFMEMLEVDFEGTSSAYADQYLIYPEADSTVRERIVSDYRNADPKSSMAAIEAYLNYTHVEADRLSQLDLPLYLISSNMFPMDIEGLVQTGLNFKIYNMDSTGHFPMVEQSENFNTHLRVALGEIAEIKSD
ncbi:MAG: alpha/beta hydrolase [Reichenbachiella sp.]|uniref:alpha/beta fold hydrolase n=1 Tax=Reichenbachiella sp. TaxID=2184521 RepID=UPI0032653F99